MKLSALMASLCLAPTTHAFLHPTPPTTLSHHGSQKSKPTATCRCCRTPMMSSQPAEGEARLARREVGRALAAGALLAAAPPAHAMNQLQTDTGDLRWSSMREMVVDAEASAQVRDVFPPPFVAYLSRFLLNRDAASAAWWEQQVLSLPSFAQVDKWQQFAGSVQAGLIPYAREGGSAELLMRLHRIYGRDQEGTRQLMILFTLVPGSYQPHLQMTQLMKQVGGVPSRGSGAPFSPLTDVTALLRSKDVTITLDPTSNRYIMEGVPTSVDFFGTVSRSPLKQEPPLGPEVYAKMAIAGATGCAVTHALVVPLDVVKTRLQTNPGRYSSLANGITTIKEEEGWRMLFRGTEPTVVGYFLYGVSVYPGYELLKRVFSALAGPTNALLFRVPLVLGAGACATVLTCFLICPFEATRIRLVAQPDYASGLVAAVRRAAADDGLLSLYGGLVPLLVRQVLFGMTKFLVFDYSAEIIYELLPQLRGSTSTELLVSLLSGIFAGVASSIVSQPADTVLSLISKQRTNLGVVGGFQMVYKEFGLGGFFLGLGSRCVWSGAIIAGQFLLYDLGKSILQVTPADLTQYLAPLAQLAAGQ